MNSKILNFLAVTEFPAIAFRAHHSVFCTNITMTMNKNRQKRRSNKFYLSLSSVSKFLWIWSWASLWLVFIPARFEAVLWTWTEGLWVFTHFSLETRQLDNNEWGAGRDLQQLGSTQWSVITLEIRDQGLSDKQQTERRKTVCDVTVWLVTWESSDTEYHSLLSRRAWHTSWHKELSRRADVTGSTWLSSSSS